MRKFLILFSLFILPLVFYIFLSKGIYRYSNLPILTTEVLDVSEITSSDAVRFKDHLNVVCFLGNDIKKAKASMFNLNQVIYKRYHSKLLFQIVAIVPENKKVAYKAIIEELSAFTDISNWNFVYTNAEDSIKLFESFKTPHFLDENLNSVYAHIVDMELRLRGRKDDEDMDDGKLYGYDMRSVAVLKNKMKDDIDIIYYQLKKSAEKQAKINRNNN